MKKFIRNCFTLVFILLILAVSAEQFVRSIPNSYKYKDEWVMKNRNEIKTLILGGSHLYAAVNPALIDSAFSLSNSAQNLEYDYLLIEKYSKVCPNLKNVVIPIDYVNLFQDDFDVDGAPDWNRSIYYNLYMDIKKYGTMSKFHYELSCPRYMISKIFRYTWSKFNGKFYDIGCDSLGRGTDYLLNGVEKHIDSVIFTRQNNMNYDILSKTKGLNLNHLRRIKSLCSKRKIRLIAVHTPCWHSYNENLDSARLLLLEEGIEYAKNFLRIDYYDYRDDRRFCYTNHFFFDTHHLSEFGADFFTDLIKKDANI